MSRLRFPVWLISVLLALVTIALYWPATRCGFVNYDDPYYVTANPHVQAGLNLAGVKWAFFNREVHFGYWLPLTLLSHMADSQLFGLQPWGHHLTSVLLHAVNTVLVFLLLHRLTGALCRSLVVAALFGLHPVHVESVAWVAERKDVLSSCFGLLALAFYSLYAQKAGSGKDREPSVWVRPLTSVNYWLALLFFTCGLMSKPMLVTWPFVMLLLDYWPLERFKLSRAWLLVTEKTPFFALALVASVVTFVVSKRGGALMPVQYLPLGARSANALISYCRYLGKMFWPVDLAVFYPHPGHWSMARVLLAGGLLLGISVVLVVKGRRYPFLLVGWLWYCGMLVPTSGLMQVGEFAMADRYTYIPSLGVLILAIWSAYELTRHWRYHVIALSVVGLTAIILCLPLTRQQLSYWQDNETLFRHAVEVTENNPLARSNLGAALLKKGQIDEAITQYQEVTHLKPDNAESHFDLGAALGNKGKFGEAIRQYQVAIRLKPDYANAHNNLGAALLNQGQADEAIAQFKEAMRLKPDFADAHNNIGAALFNQGQTDKAIRQFKEALRLRPDNADAHNNLGAALLSKGQTDEAIRQYQEALRLKPDYSDARDNLQNALLKKGQVDEAFSQPREAPRLKPDDAAAHYDLGTALLKKGQTDEAISEFEEAIRLKPDYARAHGNLGIALGMRGQIDKAISQFQEAVRLKPDDAAAHYNLGAALFNKGQTDEAIGQFREAIRLKPDYAEARSSLQNALLKQGQADGGIR